MHTIVTGMNGTVAPALAAALRERGAQVTAWDRAANPPDSEGAVRMFIERHRPVAVCHVATGAPEWAQWIAIACGDLGIPLLWTGSVSVFGSGHTAPFTPDMRPDATDDYGKYKILCESLVREANPRAIIARLGWQIGDAPGSNTMTDFLVRAAATGRNRIEASERWIPSCAVLGDTAAALAELLSLGEPGVYHLEGNRDGLTFHEIAVRIGLKLGASWDIKPVQTPALDNRMADPRVRMNQVASSLPAPA
jgi:dTDP-4-dehydrorhamnose reductase